LASSSASSPSEPGRREGRESSRRAAASQRASRSWRGRMHAAFRVHCAGTADRVRSGGAGGTISPHSSVWAGVSHAITGKAKRRATLSLQSPQKAKHNVIKIPARHVTWSSSTTLHTARRRTPHRPATTETGEGDGPAQCITHRPPLTFVQYAGGHAVRRPAHPHELLLAQKTGVLDHTRPHIITYERPSDPRPY
jgi:hypothetical protein